MTALLLLLFVGPLWAHEPVRFWGGLNWSHDQDSTAWVVVRVDSLNLGNHDDPDCHKLKSAIGVILDCGPDSHTWVYDPDRVDYFRSEAQLPSRLLGPGERWAEREKERICRVCLRREWVASKMVPKPKAKSEFEQLRERLVAEHYDASVTFADEPDSLSITHPDTLRAIVERLWPSP